VLLWLVRHTDGGLRTRIYSSFEKNNSSILEEIGALNQVDGYWAIDALRSEGHIKFEKISDGFISTMTPGEKPAGMNRRASFLIIDHAAFELRIAFSTSRLTHAGGSEFIHMPGRSSLRVCR
jgi:hypothetical protein